MYIISVKTTPNFHAGQKAPSDIVNILKSKYDVKEIYFDEEPAKNFIEKISKRLKYGIEFLKCRISGDIVLIQAPLPETSNVLNKFLLFHMNFLNKKKTIMFIHDINGLRFQDKRLYNVEISRFNKVKYLVVHNNKMKDELKNKIKSNIYVLNLFDYLCDDCCIEHKSKKDFRVVYAGNLSAEKSPFIHQIEDKKINFNINVYGIGIENDISKKIKYCGKYPSNVLPNVLDGELGLIWDGNFDESDSEIKMKNYTKYNNPHKLSCYMAAGLPVIVWEKSAISEFVKKNNIGYTIRSIYDINNIDLSDYDEKVCNVNKIKERVRNGKYTLDVISKIIKEMNK